MMDIFDPIFLRTASSIISVLEVTSKLMMFVEFPHCFLFFDVRHLQSEKKPNMIWICRASTKCIVVDISTNNNNYNSDHFLTLLIKAPNIHLKTFSTYRAQAFVTTTRLSGAFKFLFEVCVCNAPVFHFPFWLLILNTVVITRCHTTLC